MRMAYVAIFISADLSSITGLEQRKVEIYHGGYFIVTHYIPACMAVLASGCSSFGSSKIITKVIRISINERPVCIHCLIKPLPKDIHPLSILSTKPIYSSQKANIAVIK